MTEDEVRRMAERAAADLGWQPCRIVVARRFRDRLLGMTVRKWDQAGEEPMVMAFPHCASVHTCFMAYPLDIAMLDAKGACLACFEGVEPWSIRSESRADMVLERRTLLDSVAEKGPGRSFRKKDFNSRLTLSQSLIY